VLSERGEVGREAICPRSASCSLSMAPARPASEPRPGDRILVFNKERWLALILSEEKTMEVRGANYKSGRYFLGSGGFIYAQALSSDLESLA